MSFLKNIYSQFISVFNNGAFGISLFEFGIIIFSIIFSLLIRGVFAKIVVSKVKKVVKKTGNKIDDNLFEALVAPFKLLPVVIVFLFITLYFDIQSTLGIYLQKINTTLSTIFIFWLIHQSITPLSNLFHKLDSVLTKALVIWIIKIIKYFIIFLGSVAVLEVWGIKIGPVIAGLGLFGVAVALGAQDLFKNLISGIMILLEKRFNIGDVISLPGHTEGVVEHIGFRSTLIRKFDSTPITLPNHFFSDSPILNFSKRNYRRINWIIGLEYSTSVDTLKKITQSIRDFISSNNKNFKIDENHRCFVRLEQFNDSSLDILIYCFTNTNNWDDFLKIKEDLAYNIKIIVENNKASFAFPSTSIYIEKNDYNV